MDDPAAAGHPWLLCVGSPDLVLPPPRRVSTLPLQRRPSASRARDDGDDHGRGQPVHAYRRAYSRLCRATLDRGSILRDLPVALACIHGDPSRPRRALRRCAAARAATGRNRSASGPLLPLCGDPHPPRRPGTRLEEAPRVARVPTEAARTALDRPPPPPRTPLRGAGGRRGPPPTAEKPPLPPH